MITLSIYFSSAVLLRPSVSKSYGKLVRIIDTPFPTQTWWMRTTEVAPESAFCSSLRILKSESTDHSHGIPRLHKPLASSCKISLGRLSVRMTLHRPRVHWKGEFVIQGTPTHGKYFASPLPVCVMESITGQMLCRDRQMLFQKTLEELSAERQSGWAPGARASSQARSAKDTWFLSPWPRRLRGMTGHQRGSPVLGSGQQRITHWTGTNTACQSPSPFHPAHPHHTADGNRTL